MQIITPPLLPKLELPQLQVRQSPEPEDRQTINKSSSMERNVPVVSPPVQPQKEQLGVAEIFYSTFLTVFLAEFGDKTQLSTLLMSAESHSPWVVFLGSAAALITTSLLGVLLGQWLATRLAPKTLETAVGASLLLISVMLLWDVARF